MKTSKKIKMTTRDMLLVIIGIVLICYIFNRKEKLSKNDTFRMTGTGGCAGLNDYTKKNQTLQQCKKICLNDDNCVSFEMKKKDYLDGGVMGKCQFSSKCTVPDNTTNTNSEWNLWTRTSPVSVKAEEVEAEEVEAEEVLGVSGSECPACPLCRVLEK